MNDKLKLIPDDVRNYIRNKMAMTSDSDFTQVEKITEGMSGAKVYRVKIKSKRARLSGDYIVKCVDTTGRWYQEESSEKTRYASLISHCQQFQNRLVKVICSEQIGTNLIIIYSQAMSSVAHSVPLEKLSGRKLIKHLRCISYELLSIFNNACTEENGGQDFFTHILTYRLAPEGSFNSKMHRLLKEINSPAIVLFEQVFPNPHYYIIQSIQEWADKLSSKIFRKGNVHGDLHGKNIFCWNEIDDDSLQYSIIDYDSYREDGYLLFDHAYLELYFYLLNHNNDNDSRQWIRDLTPLITPSLFSVVEEEPGMISSFIRNAVCGGIGRWGEEFYPENRDDIEIQFRMARIAAGINFFSKAGIQDDATLTKLLLYICMNLKILFREIEWSWKDSPTTTIATAQAHDDNIDILWDNAVKYIQNTGFVPILITDDQYAVDDYERISSIYRLPWTAVFEIGTHRPPDDLSSHHPNTIGFKDVKTVDLINDTVLPAYIKNSCFWVTVKNYSGETNETYLWRNCGKKIRKILEGIQSSYSMQPIIYIFDLSSFSLRFSQHFMTVAIEDARRKTRFVFLRDCGLTEEEQQGLRKDDLGYLEAKGTTLHELSETVDVYLPEQQQKKMVILPSIPEISQEPLTEKELVHFRTSVELVYSGLEDEEASEEDFGESFYHGNEVRWYDLAHNYDFPLIRNYASKLVELRTSINESGHRIKELCIIHGAGTGGTTLAKRILWDLRNEVPCMRLVRYTEDTSSILMDIYYKTRKRLLLVIETGSTVISNEQLFELKNNIRARSGKLMVLRIERSKGGNEVSKDPLIQITDTLPNDIALKFYKSYSIRTSSSARKENLRKLTHSGEDEWLRQRCAFFYGFYTYVEDYNMTEMINYTVGECTDEEKMLLSDMALITIYSQNICIPHAELCARFPGKFDNINAFLVCQFIKSSIAKLVIQHHQKGLRICHPFVAKKLLEQIWNKSNYKECVFSAACQYIDHIYAFYGETEEAILIFKELFIEREIVDSQRMKFAQLIEDIERTTDKKQLFSYLIKYYPQNAHYYNHIARLMVANRDQADYDNALTMIEQAVSIAEENGDGDVSMHYITMGSILAKKIHSILNNEISMVRLGVGYAGIKTAIEQIEDDYVLADGAFASARENATVLDSYSFFPCIHMEGIIIQDLRKCDNQKRSISQLIDQNPEFKEWYMIHFSRICELFDEMSIVCRDAEVDMVNKARDCINYIRIVDKGYYFRKLQRLVSFDNKNALWARRVFSNMIYFNNGFSWKGVDQESLSLVINALEKNLQFSFDRNNQGDIITWFDAFRHSTDFDPIQAINYISEYMQDGFRKEYLLSWLYFLLLENRQGVRQNFFDHLTQCKNLTPQRYSTISWHDAYSNYSDYACPIVSKSEVERNKFGEILQLKDFYGTIKSVDNSSFGIVILDDLALDVVFTTSYKDETNNSYQFTINDEGKRAVFHLMFSYSGLRAWNIRLIPAPEM